MNNERTSVDSDLTGDAATRWSFVCVQVQSQCQPARAATRGGAGVPTLSFSLQYNFLEKLVSMTHKSIADLESERKSI